MSDKISLPRILEAAEKATPGPWLDMSNINEGIHGDVVRCDKGLDSDMAEICRNPEGDDRPNDMAYIALVDPSTIRAMVLAIQAAMNTERYATSVLGFECGALHENDLALKQLRTVLTPFIEEK